MVMIRRIGFRRLLPMLFTLVHVTLLLCASEQRHRSISSYCVDFAYHPVAYQEDSSVRWEPMEPKPLLPAQKIAILLNLPALFLAIPVALMLFHGDDLASLYAAVPFVPLVWYGVGRWLDGLFGYVSRSHAVPRVWSGLFAVLSTGLLILSVLMVTPANHHRRPDTYWVGTALVVWSAFFVATSLSCFYRRPSQLT
jgi:hypothetical protein